MRNLLGRLKLGLDFILFYWRAETIYTQDSPTLYSFCKEALDGSIDIKKSLTTDYRNECRSDKTVLNLKSLGATSQFSKSQSRTVRSVEKTSSSSSFKCKILLQIAIWSKAQTILELGTNLGILTSSLAENGFDITTVEGDLELYRYATSHLNKFKNCASHHSLFENFLDSSKECYDLIIIDGDHNYESTLKLISLAKYRINTDGIIIIDDIRWSKGMKKAWFETTHYNDFNLVIDLFMIGVVSHRKHLKAKYQVPLIPAKYKPWPYHFFRT